MGTWRLFEKNPGRRAWFLCRADRGLCTEYLKAAEDSTLVARD